MRRTIKLVGIGGQGVVAMGIILARSFFDEGYHVLQSQTYGAASRGALSSASVIVQDVPIMDLSFDIPDILILLSRESVVKHQAILSKPSKVLIDDLFKDAVVTTGDDGDLRLKTHDNITWIPASSLALKHFNEPIMVNMIVLGSLSFELSSLISKKTIQKNIAKQWPRWEKRNLQGFEIGWEWSNSNQ